MRYIKLFESYTSANSDYSAMVSTVPNFKNDFEKLAEAFLRDLGKNYVLRKGEKFNPKIGNCAWYSKMFFTWCENQRLPIKLIYFDETDSKKEAHIAPYLEGWVIDFTYKQFSMDPDQSFKVGKPEDYKKLGYSLSQENIYDEFPSWIETIYSLKRRSE
jgi:hypothetical protein